MLVAPSRRRCATLFPPLHFNGKPLNLYLLLVAVSYILRVSWLYDRSADGIFPGRRHDCTFVVKQSFTAGQLKGGHPRNCPFGCRCSADHDLARISASFGPHALPLGDDCGLSKDSTKFAASAVDLHTQRQSHSAKSRTSKRQLLTMLFNNAIGLAVLLCTSLSALAVQATVPPTKAYEVFTNDGTIQLPQKLGPIMGSSTSDLASAPSAAEAACNADDACIAYAYVARTSRSARRLPKTDSQLFWRRRWRHLLYTWPKQHFHL